MQRKACCYCILISYPSSETTQQSMLSPNKSARKDPYIYIYILNRNADLSRIVKPGSDLGSGLLKARNLIRLLQCDADVVQSIDEAVLAEGVNVKRDLGATFPSDGLAGQVDVQQLAFVTVLHELVHLGPRKNDGKHAILNQGKGIWLSFTGELQRRNGWLQVNEEWL